MSANRDEVRRLVRSELNRISPRWCWTLNNPGDWRPSLETLPQIEYAIYQLEQGAAGTQHLQGYLRLRTRRQGNSVKLMLGHPSIHLEVARGSEEHNRDYCSKDDTRVGNRSTVVEYGTYDAKAGKQGNRTDLELATEALDQNVPMQDVARAHASTFVKYHRGLSAYALLIQPEIPRQRDVRVSWIWGPTGTGKTHWMQMYHDVVFMVSAGRDPWNSYSNQETICLDEFNDSEWPVTTLNKIVDKWPFELDRRYENRCAAWTHVIICSNCSPLSCYPSAPPDACPSVPPPSPEQCLLLSSQGLPAAGPGPAEGTD